MVSKLFVITRADLSEGQQAVQGMHALQEFNIVHPHEAKGWYDKSNTLAFLVVANEEELGVLYRRAVDRRVPVAPFREPDRDNELTAIAIGPQGKKVTQGLSVAFRRHDPPQQRQPNDHGG